MARKVITCPFCGEEDVPVVKGTNAPGYYICPSCASRGFAKKKSMEKLEERLRLQEEEGPPLQEEEDSWED